MPKPTSPQDHFKVCMTCEEGIRPNILYLTLEKNGKIKKKKSEEKEKDKKKGKKQGQKRRRIIKPCERNCISAIRKPQMLILLNVR